MTSIGTAHGPVYQAPVYQTVYQGIGPRPSEDALPPARDKAGSLRMSLHAERAGDYSVELRFRPPESEDEFEARSELRLDWDELALSLDDHESYGQLLGAMLFADMDMAMAFRTARISTEGAGVPLRMQLAIDPAAQELHDLHWEALRDPENGAPIGMGERIFFSRYVRPARSRTAANPPGAHYGPW